MEERGVEDTAALFQEAKLTISMISSRKATLDENRSTTFRLPEYQGEQSLAAVRAAALKVAARRPLMTHKQDHEVGILEIVCSLTVILVVYHIM